MSSLFSQIMKYVTALHSDKKDNKVIDNIGNMLYNIYRNELKVKKQNDTIRQNKNMNVPCGTIERMNENGKIRFNF